MWQDLLARVVFAVGDIDYLWVDVVLDAMARGRWVAFERTLDEGIACEGRAADEDAWPSEADVEAAGDAFRYERDLLAAADLTAWLERVDLSLEDWLDFLRRRVLRAAWDDRLTAIVDRFPASPEDRLEIAPADGLCSGALPQLAESLAGRAAVVHRAIAPPAGRSPETRPFPFEHVPLGWFPSWSEDRVRAHSTRVHGLATRFEDAAREAVTPTSLD